MQIILQEDVEKLGTRGEVVEVAAGYARNYLLPINSPSRFARKHQTPWKKSRITLSKRHGNRKGRCRTAGRPAQ